MNILNLERELKANCNVEAWETWQSFKRKYLNKKKKPEYLTKSLLSMQIGETLEFKYVERKRLNESMVSARTISSNPGMKWLVEQKENSLVVTRTEDFAPTKLPTRLSPISKELISMEIGDSKISSIIHNTSGVGSISSTHKYVARKHLNKIDANWKSKLTNIGVRITRVS